MKSDKSADYRKYIEPNKIQQAANYIEQKISKIPRLAITLGSGLGNFAERIENAQNLSSQEIPHYPSPTVEGHYGQLLFGEINSIPVVGIQGRSHYYEGRSLKEIVFYVDLLDKLSIKYFILTNAAGGVDPDLKPGDLVILDSYLNFTQIERPFLDKDTNPFSQKLVNLAHNVAAQKNIKIMQGKYCWTTGPSFETWEEVKVCQKLNVAVVGMSTVPELQRAAALKLKTIGISLVTNMAAGINGAELSHEEVQETADKAKTKYSDFITGIIGTLKNKD
ncbi:MAG: purine-nucleoside phosphorylase [Candidatus Marinimicrobia bacterium]|nr:purine-nucleoside phosphorylase [Candidatus Neomarinimicrobiota bacterium]